MLCVCMCVRVCVRVCAREREREVYMEEESIPLCESLFFSPSFPSSFFLSQTTDQLHILWQFPEDELQIFVERAEKNKTKEERQEQRVGRSEVESNGARAHTHAHHAWQ